MGGKNREYLPLSLTPRTPPPACPALDRRDASSLSIPCACGGRARASALANGMLPKALQVEGLLTHKQQAQTFPHSHCLDCAYADWGYGTTCHHEEEMADTLALISLSC